MKVSRSVIKDMVLLDRDGRISRVYADSLTELPKFDKNGLSSVGFNRVGNSLMQWGTVSPGREVSVRFQIPFTSLPTVQVHNTNSIRNISTLGFDVLGTDSEVYWFAVGQ